MSYGSIDVVCSVIKKCDRFIATHCISIGDRYHVGFYMVRVKKLYNVIKSIYDKLSCKFVGINVIPTPHYYHDLQILIFIKYFGMCIKVVYMGNVCVSSQHPHLELDAKIL